MRHLVRHLSLLLTLAIAMPWSTAEAQEWTLAPEVEESEPPPLPPEEWQTLYGPFVRVHGAPQHHALLLRLARHASEALPRLAEKLQVPIGDTVHIYLAENDARFRDLQPGRPPTWADATAYPARGIIYLRAPAARGGMAQPIEQVLDHELSHILLGRAFAPHPTPSWLQEGVAQVMAGEYTPETTRALARGMLAGELLSLDSLARGFPSDPLEARLAYAQSADFVSWLLANHGEESLGVLIREMASGRTANAAVYAATGRFLDDVDSEWRAGLVDSPLVLTPLFEGIDVVLLGLGGVMLVVAGVMRRRRFHRRLEEMEEEERLVDELLAQTRGDLRDLRTH